MADYAVSTVFTGKDQITDKLRAMGAAVDKFGHDARGAFDRARTAGLSFKTLVGGILMSNVISRGTGLIGQGVRSAIDEYIDFDDAITAASAHFDTGYARGSKVFVELGKTAREVGATTEYSSAQAARGLDFLAKAGLGPVFAMRTLKSYVDLATASAEEFESATSMAADIMGAFRLNTGTTEERIQKFVRANDTLVKIVNMSNLSLSDLFETIKSAGPVAVDAEVSLEKFGAIAAFVGGAGIKGSLSGTAIRSALLTLTGTDKKANELFGSLKIGMKDTAGNIRDPIQLFEELRKKTEKMGSAQRLAVLGTIFGERAISSMSVSIAGGYDALNKYEQALKDAGGEAARTAELMRQSIGKRLDTLKSSAIEFAFKFFDAFEKKIPGGVDKLTEAIRKFDVKPAIEAVTKFADALAKTIDVVGDLLPVIKGITAGILAYKAILIGWDAAQWFLRLAGAIKVAGGAQAAFNVVLAANPIGAAAVAVGLLVTAGVALAAQWKEIKEIWQWLDEKWTSFKTKHEWLFGAQTKEARSWNERMAGGIPMAGIVDQATLAASKKGEIARVDYRGLLPPSATPIAAATQATPSVGAKLVTSDVEPKGQSTVIKREAPNKNDIARQRVEFDGRLQIAGAPPGSKLQSKTIGAPPVRTELIGVNP